MKKAAILSIAAFYLLLTTGMFVCIVHCAGERFFKPQMAMQMMGHHSSNSKHHKHNTETNDCDCCNKHGNFVIKENIKPATVSIQSPMPAFIVQPFNYIPVTPQYATLNIFKSLCGKAPPNLSGKAISIQLHSLQI